MGKRFPSYERRATPGLTEEIYQNGAGRNIPQKESHAAIAGRIEANAPGGEEILRNFMEKIDSILTLRMPLKKPGEVKEIITKRLEEERERAKKIDANFSGKTPATNYLEKKLGSLKP